MIFKSYLTKSKEVSELLSNALEIEKQELIEKYRNSEINISYGKIYKDASFPGMFHDCGYYHATIVIHTDDEKYEIVIA